MVEDEGEVSKTFFSRVDIMPGSYTVQIVYIGLEAEEELFCIIT